MVLVDTSVWIEVFKKGNPLSLTDFVEFEEIVACLPVVQEVLQGFRDESAYRLAREALQALPVVESPMGREIFEQAVDLYRHARSKGLTVRSSIDCLIAACALRHDLTVLHRDRDFSLLARISPLKERSIDRGIG